MWGVNMGVKTMKDTPLWFKRSDVGMKRRMEHRGGGGIPISRFMGGVLFSGRSVILVCNFKSFIFFKF